MIQILMLLSLTGMMPAGETTALKPVTTCVWPHICKQEAPAALAQFHTCVWPNKCNSHKQEAVVAQFRPCVWPNKCAEGVSAENLQFN